MLQPQRNRRYPAASGIGRINGTVDAGIPAGISRSRMQQLAPRRRNWSSGLERRGTSRSADSLGMVALKNLNRSTTIENCFTAMEGRFDTR
jgi:hypothetical protein